MLTFEIKDGLDDILRSLTSPNYAKVGEGMDLAGGLAANVWEAAAYGAKLPGMTRAVHMPMYAQSIEHHQRGEFAVTVQADDAMTKAATDARAARDMKPGLLGGPKAKKGTHGRYNIIPFHHSPENLSNDAVMALLQNLKGFRSDFGRRSKFAPIGQHMAAPMQGPLFSYTWTTGHESGIRMGNSGPVTFRTVSDRSPASSWWYPALPENPILQAVWDMAHKDIEEIVFMAWVEAMGLDR